MPQGDYEGALKRALLIYRQNGWKSLMQGGVGIGMLMLWDWDKGIEVLLLGYPEKGASYQLNNLILFINRISYDR
jgi:hypothetical protein